MVVVVCVVSAIAKAPFLNVSYKPQKISPKSQGTVRQLLHERIRDAYIHPQFITDVIKPLQVEPLYDQEVLILCFYDTRHVSPPSMGKTSEIIIIYSNTTKITCYLSTFRLHVGSLHQD